MSKNVNMNLANSAILTIDQMLEKLDLSNPTECRVWEKLSDAERLIRDAYQIAAGIQK